MAIYLNLPVYKASYDLLLKIFRLTKELPREYKYSLGQDLRHTATDLIKYIFVANSTHDKIIALSECRARVETIRLYLRLLFDLKVIGLDMFVATAEINESVSKQLNNWQKYYQQPELSTVKT
jgi:hypothetical protein